MKFKGFIEQEYEGKDAEILVALNTPDFAEKKTNKFADLLDKVFKSKNYKNDNVYSTIVDQEIAKHAPSIFNNQELAVKIISSIRVKNDSLAYASISNFSNFLTKENMFYLNHHLPTGIMQEAVTNVLHTKNDWSFKGIKILNPDVLSSQITSAIGSKKLDLENYQDIFKNVNSSQVKTQIIATMFSRGETDFLIENFDSLNITAEDCLLALCSHQLQHSGLNSSGGMKKEEVSSIKKAFDYFFVNKPLPDIVEMNALVHGNVKEEPDNRRTVKTTKEEFEKISEKMSIGYDMSNIIKAHGSILFSYGFKNYTSLPNVLDKILEVNPTTMFKSQSFDICFLDNLFKDMSQEDVIAQLLEHPKWGKRGECAEEVKNHLIKRKEFLERALKLHDGQESNGRFQNRVMYIDGTSGKPMSELEILGRNATSALEKDYLNMLGAYNSVNKKILQSIVGKISNVLEVYTLSEIAKTNKKASIKTL